MMKFDVVVVGGGHAGAEAASAAARYGAQVALITLDASRIGAMSCNPAIGGLGKGHLVREVDALGGIMGVAADAAGIQFRLLNRRKGPAVRGPRTQADRKLYASAVQKSLNELASVTVLQSEVAKLVVDKGRMAGVVLADGRILQAPSVVLTTGTFLGGLIHIGDQRVVAGRVNEKASLSLAKSLLDHGLTLGRLKTGTPPRLDGRTIGWAGLEMQAADADPRPFSFMTERITNRQIECGITRTKSDTHRIIRENLHRSALYSGSIAGIGPRYCPSIEDKIVKFGDRDGHQIFLEPEGLDDDTVYPNGISTSLPANVQLELVRSIPGLERVAIKQAGYAIEYDFVQPMELSAGLQLRKLGGLFLAGQINGTTGYEEAAAQGLVAGLNAARHASGQAEFIFSRTTSYIGVMIDDLTTRGVSEPYRMFTSRAEFRLSIRADNADRRLTPIAVDLAIIDQARAEKFAAYGNDFSAGMALAKGLTCTPDAAIGHGFAVNQDGKSRTAFDLLAAHDGNPSDLQSIWPELAAVGDNVLEALHIEARYAPYVRRQAIEVEDIRRRENALLPELDFSGLSGLSREICSKLEARRPRSVAELQKIEGMTPAAVAIVLAASRRSDLAA